MRDMFWKIWSFEYFINDISKSRNRHFCSITVEKGGARNVSYQGGPLNDGGRGGVEIFNGAWHSGGH